MVDAAGAEPGLRHREPVALTTEDVARGKPDVLEQRLAVPAARVVAEDRQSVRTTCAPGASIGTMIIECRWYGSASGSDTPMRIANLQRADAAPLVHHLCALTT